MHILIYVQKKQKKLAKLPNGIHNNNDDDPFGGGGEDDDVARIAKEMEAKYVSAINEKHKYVYARERDGMNCMCKILL